MADIKFKYKDKEFTPKSLELNYSLIRVVKQISNIVEKVKLEETKNIDLTVTFKYEGRLMETKKIIDSFKDKKSKDLKRFEKRMTDTLAEMQKDTEYLLVKSTYNSVCESAFEMALYDEAVISLIPELVNEPMTDVKLPSKDGMNLIKQVVEFFFQLIRD